MSKSSSKIFNSGGGLANAIQSELKRRAEARTLTLKSSMKPSTSSSSTSVPSATSKKPPMATLIHPDQHDQLMAEFRKVHKKMFTATSAASSSTEDELMMAATSEAGSNRSYEETLVKPPKATPPTPPQRLSSMTSCSSPTSGGTGTPELSTSIPTPDYGSSSPDEELLRAKSPGHVRTKTFSKRHPPDLFESFNPIEEGQQGELIRNQHPPYYFDPPKQIISIYDEQPSPKFQFQPKNVRFDSSVEHQLASHDYRVAHATRKAIRYTTEMHKQLAVRSGVRRMSGSSSGVSSSNTSSPRNLSSSEEEELLERHHRAKSPKKYPGA